MSTSHARHTPNNTHTNAQHTQTHTHCIPRTHTNTLSMTRNGRSFRRTSTISQSSNDVGTTTATENSYTLPYECLYVGFRDPNKEQRSWSTRSYCYCYYYYLRPCIKCTSSELSAFILRVHFQLQMEKSLRKLVHQSRL